MHQRRAVREVAEPLARHLVGVEVAVDADEPSLGAGLEDRPRVTGQPERAVDVDRAGPLQRGAQQIDDPVTHDRIVHVREP